MKNYVICGAVILLGAITGMADVQGLAAQTSCKLYKVNAPILDVRKDAKKPGGYIDVLEGDNIVCISREQKVGNRKWGYVAHRVLKDGKSKPIKGWVGLRFLSLQSQTASNNAAPKSTAKTKSAPPSVEAVGLMFDQPVPFGAFPVRGNTLKKLVTKGKPLFSPLKGLDESLWKMQCANCHKWNQKRLCNQGASYIKSAKAVFRHQHPYGGTYKLALMRWAKAGCK